MTTMLVSTMAIAHITTIPSAIHTAALTMDIHTSVQCGVVIHVTHTMDHMAGDQNSE